MKIKYLAVMLVATLGLAACFQLPELPAQEEPAAPQEKGIPTEAVSLDLSLPVAGEETLWVSSDYQGKPVLVAVMATWCPWCKRSLPALDKTTAAYAGKAEVVGIFIEDDLAQVQNTQKDFKIQSKILYKGGAAAQQLGAQGFPHIMLFDKNHKLVRVWSGYSDTLADQYAAELDKLLK